MSIEIESGVIELDKVAQAWLVAYREAQGQVDSWREKADIARANIEAVLGASEVGLINGHEVISWRFSKPVFRFDATKAKSILEPEMLALLYSEGAPVRSFRVIKDGE